MNLMTLIAQFSNEDKCRDYLEALRWPNGVTCPRCQSQTISRIQKRPQYDCDSCRYQFSVTSDTALHDTHLPLLKWFLAAYQMTESKKSVSALQLKRTLGVAYKTAWYLCHRIRLAMDEAKPSLLDDIVEADETLVGGEVRGMGRGYRGNKTIVVGVIERGGKVRTAIVPHADKEHLHAFIHEHVAPDADAIYTDEWPAYRGIGNGTTRHETVNHSAEEYVRGDVHTNHVENVWSLLERSIIGAYHHISAKHLDKYLHELEWRFNNRQNKWLFRDTLRQLLTSAHIPYDQLTAGPKATTRTSKQTASLSTEEPSF
jgi:transposase-like protein